MFPVGAEGWVKNEADKGDPNFKALWQRYQENPEETTFSSMRHGLKLIEGGPIVLYVDENRILTHLRSNPTEPPSLAPVSACDLHMAKVEQRRTEN